MCTLALFRKRTKSEYFHPFVQDMTHAILTEKQKQKTNKQQKTFIRSKSCLSNRRMLCNSCFFVTQWSLPAWFLLSLKLLVDQFSVIRKTETFKCQKGSQHQIDKSTLFLFLSRQWTNQPSLDF